jgi:pimeloyl-ACP methyl ester carboxylesterase
VGTDLAGRGRRTGPPGRYGPGRLLCSGRTADCAPPPGAALTGRRRGGCRPSGFSSLNTHFDNAYSPEDAERIAELARIDDERDLTADEQDEWRRIDWRYYHADPANPPPFLERDVSAVAGAEGLDDTRTLLAEDFFRPLGSQPVPTLVLSNAEGPCPPWVFQEMTALIHGAVAGVIPGAGHYPWYEQPTAMKTAIATFLAAIADQEPAPARRPPRADGSP